MGKKIDLTGQKFGLITVIEETDKRSPSGDVIWLCKCDCGNYCEYVSRKIRNTKYLSCGCYKKTKNETSTYNDLTGQRFGRLIAIKDTDKRRSNSPVWLCRCDCGNEIETTAANLRSGGTKSCGCLKFNKGPQHDITGQIFGHLTALYPIQKDNKNNCYTWHCKCDCGNECDVLLNSLTSGNTSSCGCHSKDAYFQTIDITNQQFGLLTALEPLQERINGCTVWKCKCECGSIKNIPSSYLLRGSTISCGCAQKSKGELKIEQILSNNNIIYQEQQSFDSCTSSKNSSIKYRFDFYIENKYLIEYDGQQHFSYTNSGWNTKENFEETQRRDAEKNQWCKDNNIPLIRIPYTRYNDLCLEDLLLETTQFRVI